MASQLEGGMPFLGQPPTPEAAHAQLSKDIKYSKAALAGATNERDLILRYWRSHRNASGAVGTAAAGPQRDDAPQHQEGKIALD